MATDEIGDPQLIDPSTLYTATITTFARDASGNPLAVRFAWNFTALVPADGTAILAWDPVTAASSSAYRMYCGTAPRTYIQPFGNVSTYTITGLNSGTRYYFVATAYDTSGTESPFSNEVFKDIP